LAQASGATPQAANHIPHLNAVWDERLLADGAAALMEAVKGSRVKFVVYQAPWRCMAIPAVNGWTKTPAGLGQQSGLRRAAMKPASC
jgi:hypothetical protein